MFMHSSRLSDSTIRDLLHADEKKTRLNLIWYIFHGPQQLTIIEMMRLFVELKMLSVKWKCVTVILLAISV